MPTSSTHPNNLEAVLAHAVTIAQQAGAFLVERFSQPHEIHTKGRADYATEADRGSEALIVEALRMAYPDYQIIAEEGGQHTSITTTGMRWHIDPLDGTLNFLRGIPHFSISIALADQDDLPVLGVVYDPMMKELFTALRGGGAQLNGHPLHVTATADLAQAVLGTGLVADRHTNPDNNTEEWATLMTRTTGLRLMGSAALNLSYVAAGRLDGYWERAMHAWDVQAGLLLVTEAGGRVSNYRGLRQGVYDGQSVVASNGLIHERLLTLIVLGRDAPH